MTDSDKQQIRSVFREELRDACRDGGEIRQASARAVQEFGTDWALKVWQYAPADWMRNQLTAALLFSEETAPLKEHIDALQIAIAKNPKMREFLRGVL